LTSVNGSQRIKEFEPEKSEGVVLTPPRIVLGPGHADDDGFIDQTLIFEQYRTLRTGKDGDMRRGILNAEILKERRLHHDVAQIPIFQDEDAFRLTGQFGSAAAQLIHDVNERSEQGLDETHKLSLARTDFEQDSWRGGIRHLSGNLA
jgi:hypothetical protein